MSKLKESDLLIPALEIVRDNPMCDTAFIKEEIGRLMYLSPEDLEPLANRNDLKYTQIVRNLCSSHWGTNSFSKYVDRFRTPNNRYKFKLNNNGISFLGLTIQPTMELFNDFEDDFNVQVAQPYDSQLDIDKINNRVPKLNEGSSTNHRYKTDTRLAKTVLKKANYVCELTGLVGNNHDTFDAKTGNKYLEAHHLIPMKAQKYFPNINLDRTENIVALCPTCHKAIHFGTISEKRKYLKPLFEKREQFLKAANITISFEDLINRFYK